MSVESLIEYCELQSAKKWQTAEALFASKRYADCLFFCHLALEFALKKKVVAATNQPFPFSHDLQDLARKASLYLTPEQDHHLAIINTFNIAGRYDDYKLSFYKKATRVYARRYFLIVKNILLWLKKQ